MNESEPGMIHYHSAVKVGLCFLPSQLVERGWVVYSKCAEGPTGVIGLVQCSWSQHDGYRIKLILFCFSVFTVVHRKVRSALTWFNITGNVIEGVKLGRRNLFIWMSRALPDVTSAVFHYDSPGAVFQVLQLFEQQQKKKQPLPMNIITKDIKKFNKFSLLSSKQSFESTLCAVKIWFICLFEVSWKGHIVHYLIHVWWANRKTASSREGL